jgi:hypothetical protein
MLIRRSGSGLTNGREHDERKHYQIGQSCGLGNSFGPGGWDVADVGEVRTGSKERRTGKTGYLRINVGRNWAQGLQTAAGHAEHERDRRTQTFASSTVTGGGAAGDDQLPCMESVYGWDQRK